MGEFNSDDHYIYYCGQESLRRNGVATMVNKRVPKEKGVWNSHGRGKDKGGLCVCVCVYVFPPSTFLSLSYIKGFYLQTSK